MTIVAALVALVVALPALVLAVATLVTALKTKGEVKNLHIAVNSRLTELLEITAAASKAQGKLEGPDQKESYDSQSQ